MNIARIDITGTINQRTVRELSPIIDYVTRRRRIKGAVLFIDSGGGDATSSQILYSKIKKLNSSKPTYASIQSVGASGAYWIASAARRIYALDTSLVGSIGVISIVPNVRELMKKIGVDVRIMKVGKYKDMLSPFSQSNKEMDAKYERIMDHMFSIFRDEVMASRKFTREQIDLIATGEIFSSTDAKGNGLIDEIGDFENAMDALGKELKLKPNPRTFAPPRPLIRRLIGSYFVEEFLYKLEEDFFRIF